MSIEPHDFLATANRLIGNNMESDLRSAASRAYYCALHSASAALPKDIAPSNADLRKKGSHKTILDALELWAKGEIRNGRTEAAILAKALPKLRNIRQKADYELDHNFSAEEAHRAIAIATSVVDGARRVARRIGVSLA